MFVDIVINAANLLLFVVPQAIVWKINYRCRRIRIIISPGDFCYRIQLNIEKNSGWYLKDFGIVELYLFLTILMIPSTMDFFSLFMYSLYSVPGVRYLVFVMCNNVFGYVMK